MNYNLLEEKWIPVLYKDGKVDCVNILDAFAHAGRIREIAASNPMDRVAILRFLLALLYWCQGNPPDGADSISSFPPGWREKLSEKKDRFELFGQEESFYQDHSVHGVPAPATKLLTDLPSGTNIAHFRHIRDFRDGLCPACCAMALLRWSSIASASKKGRDAQMTACIHGNTPAYVTRNGANLLETLCLNWPISPPLAGDRPIWDGATGKSPLGLLKNLTWRSRRVLLAAPFKDGHRQFSCGVCCYCAKTKVPLVTSILFQPGWQRPSKGPWWDDPYLFRVNVKDRKGKDTPSVPRSPGPDDALGAHATLWQSVLQGLLQLSGGTDTANSEFTTTLLAASQELYKDVRSHAITLPALKDSTVRLLEREEEWLKQLTWRTASARTKDWRNRPRGQAVVDALCSAAAKGRAVRAGLCATSFLSEGELQQAFVKLIEDLASVGPNDSVAVDSKLFEWRERVGGILCREVARVSGLVTRGSGLRKQEAKAQATEAVRGAASRLSIPTEGINP